ncbi:MAG: hypothetical protein EB160_09310, partial [Nitrososphaeria archaeon]|nr:hypothetical protein [Nitrososphaeria archaeon]
MDAREINKYVKTHKVASYEINHIRLLEYLARTKKPIILSTGASNYDEIDFAVNLLKKHEVKKYALLQCTAKYPAPLESLNLDTIPQMRQKYKVPVGLSDHSTDPVIGPLVAVALGATIIEKHFTLDKNLPGPDHKFALDPLELKKMIQSIRDAQKSFGDGKKCILDVEKELRGFAVRSIQAIKDIKKGDKFVEGHNIDNYPLVTTPGVEESTNVSIPTTYNMIVAMCWGGGIGNNNELPWSRIKKDIRHFIRVTSSKHDQSRKNAVIMGHTTWKSIPEQNRPLKYRDNLILTSMLHDKPANTDDVRWFNNIDDIKLYCK